MIKFNDFNYTHGCTYTCTYVFYNDKQLHPRKHVSCSIWVNTTVPFPPFMYEHRYLNKHEHSRGNVFFLQLQPGQGYDSHLSYILYLNTHIKRTNWLFRKPVRLAAANALSRAILDKHVRNVPIGLMVKILGTYKHLYFYIYKYFHMST
jgi:hypothetical protein